MKQYIHPFYVKCIILTLLIYFLQLQEFSMKCKFSFRSAHAISAPAEEIPDPDPDDPFYLLRLGLGGGILEGTYFYNMGQWSYCPSCAFHVSISEVTVYGSFTSNVSSYAPSNTSYSDLWRYEPSPGAWQYWEYPAITGSGGGTWNPDPNFVPSQIEPLPLKPTTQDSANWCMFACAEALADYFDCPSDQYDFAADYWPEYDSPPDLPAGWGHFNANYLNNVGFSSYPPSEEELIEALENGWPVLARVDNTEGQAHAVIIYGYNNSGSILRFNVLNPDPSVGLERWSYNNVTSRLMENTQITIVKGITNCPN
ncbi:C39 family peptidase [Sunxiuqinia elliptica]|uniref:Papain-like cysteine protease AvrRpt2 n=1 Tax=Sunxiuqinia elliptica TaxID=655355 RepID=A0A1I2CP29_9BACT|nr:papain-like cysteine protease family protein [Sunxiuqinia elliptica]SFE69892.1 Papain-like cysteine protease AvrRpt2 [Sunxiuqinia elliptica]